MHKKKITASITIYDTPGSGGETPVKRSSGPSLESEKANDDKASVGEASSTVEKDESEIVLFAIFRNSTKSDDALGKEFWKAVTSGDFKRLKANLERWTDRKDLLDDVIAKGTDFAVWFIQNAGYARWRVFAALFDKREEMIDDVLGMVEYT